MSRRHLPNSRALITGASSGIGQALAIELAEQGVRVLLVARREDRLRQLVREIESRGHRALFVTGDITDATIRHRALEAAKVELGGLDILVNNAGISAHGRFLEARPERLRQIMEVNFFAAADMIRDAAPLLSQGTQPIVVNVGSILGKRGVPHNSEYCASKFALHGFSESLRAEFASLGIDVLVIAPARTQTELFDHLSERNNETPWESLQGSSPMSVARVAVRAIRQGRREVIPQWGGWSYIWINRLFPGLIDRILARYG